jgi:hypothetical protein
MTIYLENPMVPSNAPTGTDTPSADEGNSEILCTFTVLNNPNNYFSTSGDNLVTAQGGGLVAPQCSAQVNAAPISLSVASAFTITVAAASPPPPPSPPASLVPPTLVLLGSGVNLIASRGSGVDGGFGFYNQTPYVQLYPTNSASGQQWHWNRSTFSNELIAAGASSGSAGPLLADAGDGTAIENASGDTCSVSPSGNGYTIRDSRTGNYFSVVSNALAISATQTLSTIATLASPPPTAITLTPASVTIADNVPTGTPLAAAAVTKSDGAQFSGTLTTSYTDFFAIAGLDIITARALSCGDDRVHATVIAVRFPEAHPREPSLELLLTTLNSAH